MSCSLVVALELPLVLGILAVLVVLVADASSRFVKKNVIDVSIRRSLRDGGLPQLSALFKVNFVITKLVRNCVLCVHAAPLLRRGTLSFRSSRSFAVHNRTFREGRTDARTIETHHPHAAGTVSKYHLIGKVTSDCDLLYGDIYQSSSLILVIFEFCSLSTASIQWIIDSVETVLSLEGLSLDL